MNISIVCIGKIKEDYFTGAINEYSKRLKKYCNLNIVELRDERAPENISQRQIQIILDTEGDRILKHISENDYVFALAIEGKKTDSVSFAEYIDRLGVNGKSNIVFVIGGSLGMSENVKKRADCLLSFSDMTFPHQMMRVILLEQLYRAYRITNNEPYHK